MTDLHFDVPVVAHRLFGRRAVERLSRIRPRFSGIDSLGSRTGLHIDTGPVLYPAINRDHGSTMSIETLRAIFAEDRDVEGSNGFTVNSIWEPMGIRFVLLGIVDEVVDNHIADLVPYDPRFSANILEGIADRGRVFRNAVHMIFARDLEGRVGYAQGASKYRTALVLLPDFWPMGDDTREQNWRRWMRTVAHEFGHILKLPHMPNRDNVMWWLNSREPPQIRTTQMRIAQEAASSYTLPPSVPENAPYLGVEEGFRTRI
jgi:hypothetical protein